MFKKKNEQLEFIDNQCDHWTCMKRNKPWIMFISEKPSYSSPSLSLVAITNSFFITLSLIQILPPFPFVFNLFKFAWMDVIQALSLLPPSQNTNSNPIPSVHAPSQNQYNSSSRYNRYNSCNKDFSQQKLLISSLLYIDLIQIRKRILIIYRIQLRVHTKKKGKVKATHRD